MEVVESPLWMVEGMMVEEKIYAMVGLRWEVEEAVMLFQMERWFRSRNKFTEGINK
jgi:hypothetical protein